VFPWESTGVMVKEKDDGHEYPLFGLKLSMEP
jgi:hypothetical protein